MAKKLINNTHISGAIYQHSLEVKVTGENSKNPGTQYIAGNLEIATDDAGRNIVPVHFSYVTPTFGKSGKENPGFNTLKNIIDGVYKTVMEHGVDLATKVRIDSNIALNEFYSDRNGKEELVSVKRNEGGFIHVVGALDEAEKDRSTFDCDIVITNARRVDGDAEKNTPEKVIIKGAIFDFRNSLLPVEFSVLNPGAMDYFESLEATSKNPVFTRIKGQQVSESIVRRVEEEGAFGEPSVREYKSTRKDFVVTWAAKEPYEWDTEETMTAQFMIDAMAAREVTLAEMKKRNDDYKASKNGGAFAAAAPAAGGFNF